MAEAGYRLTSQSWAAGERPTLTGLAGLLLLLIGLFFTVGNAFIGMIVAVIGAVLLFVYWSADIDGTISATFERPTAQGATDHVASEPSRSVRDRLLELDSLRDDGTITGEEHAERRSAILDQI